MSTHGARICESASTVITKRSKTKHDEVVVSQTCQKSAPYSKTNICIRKDEYNPYIYIYTYICGNTGRHKCQKHIPKEGVNFMSANIFHNLVKRCFEAQLRRILKIEFAKHWPRDILFSFPTFLTKVPVEH